VRCAGRRDDGLPPELRTRVDAFFKKHQTWLTGILARGVERGEFSLTAKPAKTARLVFGALQGALLVKHTTSDASQLKDVIAVLKSRRLRASLLWNPQDHR